MTHSPNPVLTIVVSSTDSYKDLWDNFFKCKNKYWPDCPFNTVLVNNEEKPKIQDVEIINCGPNTCWSERMRYALNLIDSKYICFILEDFYITGEIDNKTFLSALDIMNLNGFKYLKLFSLSNVVTPEYKNFSFLQIIPANYRYGISLTPGIWEKKFLLEKIGSGDYNPWKFEADRLKEEMESNGDNIVGLYDNRNILQLTHMVVQGKYLPDAIRKCKTLGLTFGDSNRKMMSKLAFFKHKIKGFLGIKMRKYTLLKIILTPLYRKYSISYRNK